MRIDFTVGELEQHVMELSFDQSSGDLRILMDGAQLLQDFPSITTQPVSYELSVGNEERHRLALQLAYGLEEADRLHPAPVAIPRLSLMVTALTQQPLAG